MTGPLLASYELSHSKAATVSASTEDAGYPAAAVIDGDATTQWRATAASAQIEFDLGIVQTIDYWAIYGWPFPDDGSIQLETSVDGISGWTAQGPLVTPDATGAVFQPFTAVAAQYVRLSLTGTSGGTYGIALVAIGKRVEFVHGLPPPYTPPQLAENIEDLTNFGDSGLPLGSILKSRGFTTTASFIRMTPDFMRNELAPLLRIGGLHFWSWDYDNHPTDAVLMSIAGRMPIPQLDIHHRYSISITMTGVVR